MYSHLRCVVVGSGPCCRKQGMVRSSVALACDGESHTISELL